MKKRIRPGSKKAKEKGSAPQKNQKSLYNLSAYLKMSEALEELVAPYVHEARTEQQYDTLIGLGAMAWNMTVMPPEVRQKATRDMIALFGQDPEHIQFMSEKLNELMRRKEKLYPDEDRVVVSYEIEDLGNQWHLTVTSKVVPKKGEDA